MFKLATSAPAHADRLAALRALNVRTLGAAPDRGPEATAAIAVLTSAEAAAGCFVSGPHVYASGGRFGACSRRVR